MNDYHTKFTFLIDFVKTTPDYKLSKGEKYELTSIDGKASSGLFTTENDGAYSLYFADDHVENISSLKSGDLLNIFPQVLKDKLSQLKTVDDFNELVSYNEFDYSSKTDEGGEFGIYLPFRLTQVKTLSGLKKSDIVFITQCNYSCSFDNNGNITSNYIDLHIYFYDDSNSLFLFDNDFYDVNSISDLSRFVPEASSYGCMNGDGQGRIITDRYQCTKSKMDGSIQYFLVPYFVGKQGVVKFDIKNTVNGLTKYNASNNQNLNYKITITNKGNTSSIDNIITTSVPKELKLNQKSISNGGVYHRDSNTITWKINSIESGKTINLTYSAVAPKNLNGKELTSNSSIYSSNAAKTVYSNTSIVTLDRIVEIIDNPNTGSEMIYIPKTNIGIPLVLLFSFALIICITLFVVKFSRSNKSDDTDRGVKL